MIRQILESIREREFTPRGDVLEPAGGGMKRDDVTHLLEEMGWHKGPEYVPDDYAPVMQKWVHDDMALGYGKGWKAHVVLRIPVVPGPQNSWSYGEDVEYATVADMPDSVEHYDDLESFKGAVAAVMQKHGVPVPDEPGGGVPAFTWANVYEKLGNYGFQLSKYDPSGPKHPGRGWAWMVNPEYQNVEVVVSAETEAQTSPWGADPVEYVSIDAAGQTKYTSHDMGELDHHLKIVDDAFMGGSEAGAQPGAGPPYTAAVWYSAADTDQTKEYGPYDTFAEAMENALKWKKVIGDQTGDPLNVYATVVDKNGDWVSADDPSKKESVVEKEFTPRSEVLEPEGAGQKTSALHDFLVGQGWELSDFGIGKDDDEASNYYTHPKALETIWISLRDKGHFDEHGDEWVAEDKFAGASGSDDGLLNIGEKELAYGEVAPFAIKVAAAAGVPKKPVGVSMASPKTTAGQLHVLLYHAGWDVASVDDSPANDGHGYVIVDYTNPKVPGARFIVYPEFGAHLTEDGLYDLTGGVAEFGGAVASYEVGGGEVVPVKTFGDFEDAIKKLSGTKPEPDLGPADTIDVITDTLIDQGWGIQSTTAHPGTLATHSYTHPDLADVNINVTADHVADWGKHPVTKVEVEKGAEPPKVVTPTADTIVELTRLWKEEAAGGGEVDPVPAPGLSDLVSGLVGKWKAGKASGPWAGVVAAVGEKDWLSTNESGQPPSNENPMNIYPVATGKMLNVLKKTTAQQKEEIAKVLAKLKLQSEWDGGIEAFRVWPSPDVPDEDNAQTFGMLIDVLGKHVYGE